jgi:DNA invertase Pin-like site-specific DNA recombinase
MVHGERPSAGGIRPWWLAIGALFGYLIGASVALLLVGEMWLAGLYAILAVVVVVGCRRFRRALASVRPVPRLTSTSRAPDAVGANAIKASGAAEPSRPGPARERHALGYVCVARDAIARDLPIYSTVIKSWIAANQMQLSVIVHDVERGPGERGPRPALRWALERMAAGEADALVTARLAHLSPTAADLPPILRWFSGAQRTLIAIDFGLDTATDGGRLAASALVGVGGWERERLSARTRRGLAAARARGSGGGRPAVADVPELRERIARMREQGMTLQAIADVLNEEGVATLRGGAKWRPSSVQRATGYRRPPSPKPGIELPGPAPEDEVAGPRAGKAPTSFA